jgi:hypothetical protein
MPVVVNRSVFVVGAAEAISVSQMFGLTAGSGNPAYLVLTALDRNEYTVGATGATGTLLGNGRTADFIDFGGDDRGVGLVFTYKSATGRYFSSAYGFLDHLTYTAAVSLNDVTNLSLFGTDHPGLAHGDARDAYAMMHADAAGYIGSVTLVTEPGPTAGVIAQATPNSIKSVAATFVGKAWNMSGCWTLASTIAAEAGASLPVQSAMADLAGQPNGEWMVAFNGPAGQRGDWQSMVTAGEIIVIATPDGGGHITTVVSGSGTGAMLVDNSTYSDSSGRITNLANDGAMSDIIVSPRQAAQEWAGVTASSVVIYELDTPIVTPLVITANLTSRTSCSLAPLFSVADPANRPITQYQIYNTLASNSLSINGVAVPAGTVAIADLLTSANLSAGATASTDSVNVRAFNGSYWGDWQSINIATSSTTGADSGGRPSSTAVASRSYGGVDMAAIPLLKRQAVINLTNGTGTVSGPGIADALTSVARIRFIDGTLAYGADTPEAEVDRLYQAAFGRAPDASGLAYWAAALQDGTLLADIGAGFVASQEFKARYGGLDNDSFVNALYQNVLGRAADAGGHTYWAGALNSSSASQAQVLASVSESPENKAETASQITNGLWSPDPTAASVARLYYTTLDRAPDAPGLAYWTSQIENGDATLQQEANLLVNSGEFVADYGSLDNTAFVSLLYQTTLRRDADPAGLSAWTNQLAQGGSRAGVVLSFSEGAELKARLMPVIERSGIAVA